MDVNYLVLREIESITVLGRDIPVTEMGGGIHSLVLVYSNLEDAEKASEGKYDIFPVQEKEVKK